ncbi:MAG: TatD family hydrolase [Actinomycetia bacterium]|nr:TatD family hydrolase [Actinomycetes bacterium]
MATLPSPPPALPSPVIDSHVHLDLIGEFGGVEVGQGLALADAVAVPQVIQVGIDLPSSRRAVDLAADYEAVLGAAVGVHPNEAPDRIKSGDFAADLLGLAELALAPNVVAIGETGLDHFRTEPAGRHDQEAAFREHIRLARATNRTLIIHDRDAHSQVLDVLATEDLPDRVVFHCFSGDVAMAREVAAAGWFLSFSGVITFKNAPELRAAAQAVPLTSILVETDAPFLTPAPNRGRPNASYLLPYTVAEVARCCETELEVMCRQLAANTRRAFGLAIS